MTPAHLVPHTWTCAFRTHGGACDCLDRIVIDPAGAACRPEDRSASSVASNRVRSTEQGLIIVADQAWTMRAIARECGHAPGTTVELARAGLLPGYEGAARTGAAIAPELARPFARVLADDCYSKNFAKLMKADPQRALATVRELEKLALAAVELAESAEGEAAA